MHVSGSLGGIGLDMSKRSVSESTAAGPVYGVLALVRRSQSVVLQCGIQSSTEADSGIRVASC